MSRVQRAGLRQGIIQTSLEIGSERGEEGLTMRGIAARLGVSATALYQHFESKSKILREIRIYGAELLQSEVLEPAASTEDPAERLVNAGRNYVQFAKSHKWLYSVMMGNEQIDWSQHNTEEVDLLLRPLKTFQGWLEEARRAAAGAATSTCRSPRSVSGCRSTGSARCCCRGASARRIRRSRARTSRASSTSSSSR
ncbi:TetR/AcrR family transcriptional regulator [Nannocystis pusilla]|uniref:TetR/AcrR family transcriptional regulator n=1 Tax=Nannocystis pusilla TaxID=889268 RepID=UPI003B829B2D